MRGVGRARSVLAPGAATVPDGRWMDVIVWSPDGMGDPPGASSGRASAYAASGDGLDLDETTLGQRADRERGARRRRIRHVPGVDGVDRREVVDVGQEDGRLDDVVAGQPGRIEHGGQVLQAPARPGPRRRPRRARRSPGPSPSWPEHTNQPMAGDALAVRADGGRGTRTWRRPDGSWRGLLLRARDGRGDDRRWTVADRRDGARLDGLANGPRGRLGVGQRRIERPQRRTGAGQADRADPACGSRHAGRRAGRAAGRWPAASRSLADARTPDPGDEIDDADSPSPSSLGEMLGGQADRRRPRLGHWPRTPRTRPASERRSRGVTSRRPGSPWTPVQRP